MQVLFLTDSLSLPRKYKNDIVLWEDTYINQLRSIFPEINFIQLGFGGATITELHGQLNYYTVLSPDIVFLHCGIVDCAPRALGKIELELVKKFKLFRIIRPFLKLFRKYRGVTYTNANIFELRLRSIKNRFDKAKFYTIGILPGSVEYEQMVPGITKNIEKYNNILNIDENFIDNSIFPREGIALDHHHLNKLGHTELAERLGIVISEVLMNKTPSLDL